MEFNRLIKHILFPHPLFIGLFAPAALIFLIVGAHFCDAQDVVSIASYVLSFYALVIVTLRAPGIIRFAKRFSKENRFTARFCSDVRLRINVSLNGAFVFNAVYALFQLGLGLKHHSVWFYSMAGYYLLLALMRFMLIRYTKNHAPGQMMKDEWKKYRMCGISLLMMTLMLTVFILYFVLRIREFRHHEITTITMAVYTFSALTLAIVNAVRYRKYESPAYSAAKAVSLVSAIVSVLTLENAMLTVFGQEADGWFHQIMLGATGAAVVAAVQGIALYMIINANKKLITIQNRTDRRS